MLALLDHGRSGTGEALAGLLRAGSANANTAADLISTFDAALASLPEPLRGRVLIRSGGGGYSHAFFDAVAQRKLEFSIGCRPAGRSPPPSPSCRKTPGPGRRQRRQAA